MRTRSILLAAATALGAVVAVVPGADAAVDTTPPNVNFNQGLFFPVGSTLSDAGTDPSIRANMTWATNDDVGIASQYAYAYYYNGNGNYVGSTSTTSTSARQIAGVPFYANGGEIDGYDDVYDAAGNGTEGYGYWYGGLAQSNTFNLGAKWSSSSCSCWSYGSTMKSSTVGASMTYTFTGNSFAIIGDYASGRGSFKVFVNGVQQGGTYSEAGSTKNMIVVYQKRFSSRASRTIKIQVASGRVDVDAIVYSTGNTGSYVL